MAHSSPVSLIYVASSSHSVSLSPSRWVFASYSHWFTVTSQWLSKEKCVSVKRAERESSVAHKLQKKFIYTSLSPSLSFGLAFSDTSPRSPLLINQSWKHIVSLSLSLQFLCLSRSLNCSLHPWFNPVPLDCCSFTVKNLCKYRKYINKPMILIQTIILYIFILVQSKKVWARFLEHLGNFHCGFIEVLPKVFLSSVFPNAKWFYKQVLTAHQGKAKQMCYVALKDKSF